MTPTTTRRPRAALRAAVAALGVWLAGVAALNLFLVGRSATDENLFIDPLSGVYVVEQVPGQQGTPRTISGPLPAWVPRQAGAAGSLEPGDILMELSGERLKGAREARERLAGHESIEATALRARSSQVISVVVPARELLDALQSIHNTVVVVQVTPGGASARAGMLPGDVITRINGQGFADATDADRVMRAAQVGRETAYDVLRAGVPVTLEVRLAAFGIALGALLLSAVGLLYIATGTLLATLRPHIKAAYYLGLGWMGTGLAIAVILNRPRRTLPTWYVLASDVTLALCATLGVAAWLHSMKYFPRERPALAKRRWAIRGGYILAVVLAAITLGITWSAPFFVDGLFFPAAVLMLIYAVAVSARTRRSYSAEDLAISRPTSIMTGLAVGLALAPLGLAILRAATGGHLPLLPAPVLQIVGALLLLGLLVVHGLTIGRYRLLELDLRVRRNVQYLLISAAWTTVIVGAGLWLWWQMMHLELPLPNVRLTGDALEVLPTPVDVARRGVIEKGVLVAAAVVLAYAFRAVLKRGQRFLAEQYYQEGYDYRRATSEFSDVMGQRMDLQGLADGLLTMLDRHMPVKRAGVVFVQGSRLVSSTRSIGFEPADWDIFCRACVEEAVDVLRVARGAEMDTEYAPPRLRLALRRAQVHHLFPIGGHDELRGVIFVGEKLSEAPYTADDFAFLGVIAGQASLLVENAFLYENLAAQERARQELAIARRIQLESLPQRPPTVQGLDVAGASIPAQEVGGDYYDYLEGSNGHLAVMIGDVSGKGTSAALYMSKLQGIVRSLHGFDLSPRELFVRTNDLLGRDLERRAFVTALGAYFDTSSSSVVIARGGHLPLYHYEASTGRVHRWLPRGLGLGLTARDVFAAELEELHLSYAEGDTFLFVTDGITESHDADREEFGEDRLTKQFSTLAAAGTPVAQIVSAINAAATAHAAGTTQHDDQTVVVVRATH